MAMLNAPTMECVTATPFAEHCTLPATGRKFPMNPNIARDGRFP